MQLSLKRIVTTSAVLGVLSWTLCAVAFGAQGTVIWDAVYSSRPGSDNDQANGLAMDAQGNLAVAGLATKRDGNHNYLTIKYGPYGATEWVKEYDHSWNDVGRAVAFDPAGNVIVAGSSHNLDNPVDSYSGAYYTDYRVVKYSPTGDLLAEMAASGYKKNNEPSAVAVDRDGSIYVTGIAKNAPDTMPLFYTVKFDPAGTVAWEKFEDWGAESYATGLRLDPEGRAVVTGYYRDTVSDSYNIRTLKYDPATGNTLMDVAFNHNTEDEKASGLAVDAEGNIIVTGESNANDGVTLTLKYSPQGDLLWEAYYTGSEYKNRGNAVAVDRQGLVYVVGKTVKDEQSGDWLLLVYDKDGRLVSDRIIPFGGDSSAEDVAVDVYGNIVVTGTVTLPGQPGVIRTIRVEGFPVRQSSNIMSPKAMTAFDFNRRIELTQTRPMIRKVNLVVNRTDPSKTDSPVSLMANPVALPGEFEYRFFTIGASSAHHWEAVTDYTHKNFIVLKPEKRFKGPMKVMVEVRQKGSPLKYEARQELVIQ